MLSKKQLKIDTQDLLNLIVDRTLASPTSETVTTKRSPRSTYVNKIWIEKASNGNAMKLASLKILGPNSHGVQTKLTLSMTFWGPEFCDTAKLST